MAWSPARGRVLLFFSLVVSVLWSPPGWAHLGLTSPPSRYGTGTLKTGPCGQAGGLRSQNVTTFSPGETITVQWDEYINHPGHFRIAFDDDGDDDFKDPTCTAGCATNNPTFQFYTDPTILLDNIADTQGGASSAQVKLPNIECDNCTLQVIQVMYDKAPYTSPGNDVYYQCADLVLKGVVIDGGVLDAGGSVDASAPDADAGVVVLGDGAMAGGDAEAGDVLALDAGPDSNAYADGGAGPDVDAGEGDDAAISGGPRPAADTVSGGCACFGSRVGAARRTEWRGLAVLLLGFVGLGLRGRRADERRRRQAGRSDRRA